MANKIRISYFVHGTTTDNEAGIATGFNGGELSELGRIQSRELHEKLKDTKFDAIFSSDLMRAVQSAEIVFQGREIQYTNELRECNYGTYSGMRYETVKSEMLKKIDERFPVGESYKQVEKRVREFLDNLKEEYAGKHIAIMSHQGPQLALEVILNGKSWEQAIAEDWRNTGDWQPSWEYVFKF